MTGFELTARLIDSLAWPLAIVIVASLLKLKLRDLVGALAKRVSAMTKVSAFGAGVEFEAADAVGKVLGDEGTPLATREALAEAVREELNKRQPASDREFYLGSKLSAQADAVLFKAHVVRAIQAALPPAYRFAIDVRSASGEFDGLLYRGEIELGDFTQAVIVEVARSWSPAKAVNALAKLSGLRPKGVLYVVPPTSDASAAPRFASYAKKHMLPQAQLLTFDLFDASTYQRFQADVVDYLNSSIEVTST